jgi:hypothetical protein
LDGFVDSIHRVTIDGKNGRMSNSQLMFNMGNEWLGETVEEVVAKIVFENAL